MKRCRYCGTENEDNDNFCTECGKSLAEYTNSPQKSESTFTVIFNFIKDLYYALISLVAIFGAACLYYVFSSTFNTDSCETIFEQIAYLVTHYGNVHALGISVLIGLTLFNIFWSQNIQKQLTEIKNILKERT